MAKPLEVQRHEKEQHYLNPPFMPQEEWTKWENHPGEYRWLQDRIHDALSRYQPWPNHLDNDPISISQKMVQGCFWSRKTKDPGYYTEVMMWYGYLLSAAQVPID